MSLANDLPVQEVFIVDFRGGVIIWHRIEWYIRLRRSMVITIDLHGARRYFLLLLRCFREENPDLLQLLEVFADRLSISSTALQEEFGKRFIHFECKWLLLLFDLDEGARLGQL